MLVGGGRSFGERIGSCVYALTLVARPRAVAGTCDVVQLEVCGNGDAPCLQP